MTGSFYLVGGFTGCLKEAGTKKRLKLLKRYLHKKSGLVI
jgi:hypothetical protein